MIRKRPLAWMATFAIAGTLLGFSLNIPEFYLFIFFSVSILLIIIFSFFCNKLSNNNILLVFRSVIIAISIFLGFWLSALIHIHKNDLSILNTIVNTGGASLTVLGTVAGDPFIYKNKYGSDWIWKFPLRLNSLQINNGTINKENCSGSITVKWYGPPPGNYRIYGNSSTGKPEYGELWEMTGKIHLATWSKQKENYILITNRRCSTKISQNIMSDMARQCLAARRAAAKKLSMGIEDFPESAALLKAILLGYRSDLNGEMRELFASVGTLHVFAISGLHVGIVCSLIIFVLSILMIPRTHWVLLLAPLLIAYTFATGARPSAVRACIMAIIYFGAPFVWRKVDSISAVSLAALLILVVVPQQLVQIGFIYSFVVVLGLIILYPIIHHVLYLLIQKIHIFNKEEDASDIPLFWEKDDFQIQEEPRWIICVRKVIHYIVSLFALSCSAWLASVPITAYFFGRFSPIALIANVIIIPLAFLTVVTGVLSLVAGSCFVILGDIFNHANLFILYVMVNIMKIIAKIPGAFFEVEKVPVWSVFAWYAVLLYVVYVYRKRD